jgi:divalent metal cation (Fe/Co/Zn/Cd) transporter
VTLAIETKSLLLGEAASPQAVGRIRLALSGTPGVERIIHMKTLHMGPEEVLVAAKIAIHPAESAAEVAAIIDQAEVGIRAVEPVVTSLYLEPDIYREDYVPAERPERPTAAGH